MGICYYCRILAGLLIIVLVLPAPVAAAVHSISPGMSISTAIGSAASGDTIVLGVGTYNEHAIGVAKNIIIRADTENGHGPEDTIIDGQLMGTIFTCTGAYSLTIDNLTLRRGRAADGTNGNAGKNGGAIRSNGPVTLLSSRITGSSAGNGGSSDDTGGNGGDGGAIWSALGPVTVMSSTISDCSAGNGGNAGAGGPGGYGGFGGAIFTDHQVTVMSSTITGCSAGVHGTGGSGNGESGDGGAVSAGSGTISFSRLVNNENVGRAVVANTPMAATNNWWGSNSNPSSKVSGASSAPWLMLSAAAVPSSISRTGTSIIRANLTCGSDGICHDPAAGHVPDFIPVMFSRVGSGTVSPVSACTDYGSAQATFTPVSSGTTTITSAVDGQRVNADVVVTPALSMPPPVVPTTAAPAAGPSYAGSAGMTGPSDPGGSSDSGTGPAPVKAGDITFFVTSAYLSDHRVTPPDIELMSYSGTTWVPLSTRFTGSSGNRFYFTADSDGYSLLAIGNKRDGVSGLPSFAGSPATPVAPPHQKITPPVTVQTPEPQLTGHLPQDIPEGMQTPALPEAPVARQTTEAPAVPVQEPAGPPGFPFVTAALTGAGCAVLIGGGWYVRRWWIQRQNPALFRKYD